jgi:hypothetical protein
MLFEQKHFGKPISEELSVFIREYTDNSDRANASVLTGVGTSTIRDVSYRTNSLTKENSKGILQLLKIATKNCYLRIKKGNQDAEYAEEILGEKEAKKIKKEVV